MNRYGALGAAVVTVALLAGGPCACSRDTEPSEETPATSQPVAPLVTREIEVRLTVPDPGWVIRIESIHRVDDELWVVSRLSRTDGGMLTVIASVSDSITIDVPDLSVHHFVIGKKWAWENDEPYAFIDELDEIAERLEGAQLLYECAAPEDDQ